MKLSKFRYKLPPELIAQHPSANRDECRLMVVDRKTGTIEHKAVSYTHLDVYKRQAQNG